MEGLANENDECHQWMIGTLVGINFRSEVLERLFLHRAIERFCFIHWYCYSSCVLFVMFATIIGCFIFRITALFLGVVLSLMVHTPGSNTPISLRRYWNVWLDWAPLRPGPTIQVGSLVIGYFSDIRYPNDCQSEYSK